jgi:hypothetical protein
VVEPAPAEWTARVTAILAKQLPAPSVPTRIFLVDKFALKSISGKIDRNRLPDLSLLLYQGEVESTTKAQDVGLQVATLIGADIGLEPGAEKVLAICRSVFETTIGWDDGFAEAGGHSIVIARLARRLHVAGWAVSVRELLSNCNTARKVASRIRQVQSAAAASTVTAKSAHIGPVRDRSAAEVLSIGRFTVLQILFATLLYSPACSGPWTS